MHAGWVDLVGPWQVVWAVRCMHARCARTCQQYMHVTACMSRHMYVFIASFSKSKSGVHSDPILGDHKVLPSSLTGS